MVGGVRRYSRGHRSACTRTHFSGLRFGTSYESGIKEAPLSLTSEKTEISKSACEKKNDKGPVQKTRVGRVVPRAETFGDLITAEHKVLN